MADWARRLRFAARVYRSTSLSDAWPVIDAISCVVQPISARRRAHAFRSPCDETSGHPAASHHSGMLLPNPLLLYGLPKLVTRKVRWSFGVESIISRSLACTGIS